MKNKLLELLENTKICYIKKNNISKDLYKWTFSETSFLNNESLLSERIYCIINDIKELPSCYCGQSVKYMGKGIYREYCSSKCSANSYKTKNKKENTVLNKYGTKNVFENCEIKNKIKNTNIKKYGVDNYTKTEEYKKRIKSGDIKNNINYNVVSDKIKKVAYKRFKRFESKVIPLFSEEEYNGCGFKNIYKWKCVKCDEEFNHWYNNGLVPSCPKCNNISNLEKIVKEFLDNNDIKFERNNRTLINPLELDFYLPDYKVAIEVNGLFWHCESGKPDKNYHNNKTNRCNDNNIQLIHIFSDELEYKKDIVFSRLKTILNFKKYKIYARKCEIKEISSFEKSRFLNKYHIQGNDKSSIYLGLFFKNRLVSVMTFGKYRKILGRNKKDNCFELVRYCTISNFSVVGGAGKLLKHFERKNSPNEIITYADRRWSNGNLYDKLDFNLLHISSPSYTYTKDFHKRIHRSGFQKHMLKNKLEDFNEKDTEYVNMANNGYYRVFDCGNYVYKKG